MGFWRELFYGPEREDRAGDLTLAQVLGEGMPNTSSGVTVTYDSARRLPAVAACIRLLSDVVSTLPVHAYRAGAREPIDPAPALLLAPAARTSLPDWLGQVMHSLLGQGNAWGVIADRAGAGLRPSQVELIDPARVAVTMMAGRDGVLAPVWRLDGREVDRDSLWHLPGPRLPGALLGLSPIDYARQTIGLGLAAEAYGARFFGDNATPSGLLTSEQPLTGEAAQRLSLMWQAAHQGKRKTAVLGHGTSWQAVSVTAEESQFLDTQRLVIQQVCRIYGVPPEMIAADSGSAMTYANVEQRDLSLLKYAVAPWLVRIEAALTELLPRGTYAKFNASALLRTDTLTRYQSYEIGLRAGFLTNDEVRQLEDREPLPAVAVPSALPMIGVVA